MSYVEKLIKDSMIRSFFIYYPLSDLDFYRYRLQLGSFFCSFFSTNRCIRDCCVSIYEKHTQVFRWKTNKGFNDQISFYHLLTSQWDKIWNSTKFRARGHYNYLYSVMNRWFLEETSFFVIYQNVAFFLVSAHYVFWLLLFNSYTHHQG